MTNSALVYVPKCRGRGVAGSQTTSTAVHRSPNKLWRSNSKFNLRVFSTILFLRGQQVQAFKIKNTPHLLAERRTRRSTSPERSEQRIVLSPTKSRVMPLLSFACGSKNSKKCANFSAYSSSHIFPIKCPTIWKIFFKIKTRFLRIKIFYSETKRFSCCPV